MFLPYSSWSDSSDNSSKDGEIKLEVPGVASISLMSLNRCWLLLGLKSLLQLSALPIVGEFLGTECFNSVSLGLLGFGISTGVDFLMRLNVILSFEIDFCRFDEASSSTIGS